MGLFEAQLPFSVIVPVYNGGAQFRQCLTSLAVAKTPPQEVIVVSDGSTDESIVMAQKFGAKVLGLPTSCGPAKARNFGAQAAQGTYLFFLDADVAIYPDIFTKAIATLEKYPDVVALIGSYDDRPGASNFLSQYKNLLHHYTHQQALEEASTFWGACGVIRRDVFLTLGGFDEGYRRPCVEDIELGYRLRKDGHRIRLCKTLQVKHLKRWEVLSLLKADFFYRALPWTALILRDRQLTNDLNLHRSSRLSIVCVYGLVSSVVIGCWLPSFFIVAVGCSLILLRLNRSVYQFFYEKRGLKFALLTIPWHWLYYFYSGLAFMVGAIRYFVSMVNRQMFIHRNYAKS